MKKEIQGPWTQRGTSVFFAGNAGGFDLRKCPHAVDKARLAGAAPLMLLALEAILPFCAKTSASEGGAAKYSASVTAADLVREAIAQATEVTS